MAATSTVCGRLSSWLRLWPHHTGYSYTLTRLKSRSHGGFVTNAPFRKGQAKDLIYRLSNEERKTLLRELQALQAHIQKDNATAADAQPPTASQLKSVAVYNSLPFIGFGFLDNLIMIVAGDYIDSTIGAALGISTMAAAALGNMISDIAGIGSAWYVESLTSRIGVMPPPLSPMQLGMVSTRWSAHFGRAIGVALGCLLGMFPLLFLRGGRKDQTEVTPPLPADSPPLPADSPQPPPATT